MLLYTQRDETWPITKMELEGRGVRETNSTPTSTSGAFIGYSLHQLVSSGIALKCDQGSGLPSLRLIRGFFVSNRVYLFLCSLQVVCMNFFDIVLDFILMDAFEDLESPPSSVVAVLRNRWLSDSFKETVN